MAEKKGKKLILASFLVFFSTFIKKLFRCNRFKENLPEQTSLQVKNRANNSSNDESRLRNSEVVLPYF